MVGYLICLLVALLSACSGHAQENPLYHHLLKRGVTVSGHTLAVLPRPTMQTLQHSKPHWKPSPSVLR